MDLNLNNHTVVVTGGGSGIGRACVAAFRAEGARVAIWDIAYADPMPAGTIAIAVDIRDERQVAAALDQTVSELGPVRHLVHAAAIGSGKFGFPFTNLEPADWREVLDVNILGMANVAHTVSPHMVEQGAGTQVYLASVAGQIGSQTDPPYSASKAANINFAQCLAKDLAPQGIRVNTVCPGMVQTPLNRSVWQAWHDRQPEGNRLDYEQWAGEKIRQLCPLGEWQRPEDVADMVVFLSSDRARQVTGQTVNVDGGFVMHW